MEARGKKLLVLTSKLGYQTRSFLEAAQALGVAVEFATDRCHQLEDPWSDGALALNFADAQGAGDEMVRQKTPAGRPDAVLALGDRPAAAAAYAARAFGLAGNEPEAVRRMRSKLSQREILERAKLPVPEFFSFALDEPLESVVPRVKFPCVIKPLSLAASQGVIRANDPQEFRSARSRIARLLLSPELQARGEGDLDRLLVESYIPGREVAVEGLLDRGRLRILSIFDKPDPLEGPYFEETLYVTPSRLTEDQQAALEDAARRALAALGLTHGPVHAEFRINDGGPWVLEAAPRPIGGLCSRALRFGPRKISLEELLIRHALDLGGWDVPREPEASGVMMIPVPRSGILESVDGLDEARRAPDITAIEITARRKDYLAAWPEGASYLGFIFARSGEPQQAEAALREAHGKLRFQFSERLPVEHPASGRISA